MHVEVHGKNGSTKKKRKAPKGSKRDVLSFVDRVALRSSAAYRAKNEIAPVTLPRLRWMEKPFSPDLEHKP